MRPGRMSMQTEQTNFVALSAGVRYRRPAIDISTGLCAMADEVAPPEVHHYENIQEVPWDIQK